MNNYTPMSAESSQIFSPESSLSKSFSPRKSTVAPFALDYEGAEGEFATGYRQGGPKEARLHRVALLRSDKETDHLFPVRVENVHSKVTAEMLEKTFSKYGEIGNVYIPKNLSKNTTPGFALVRYVRQEDAERAVRDATGLSLHKKWGTLEVSSPPKQKTCFGGNTGSTVVGVENDGFEFKPKAKWEFTQVVSLENCMARNGAPWVSKHDLMNLEPHAPLETHQCWSLKITPLAAHVGIEELVVIFGEYGRIGNIYCPKSLLKDQASNDPHEGFAYVRYTERTSAEAALKDLNGSDPWDIGKELKIELVPPRYWPEEKTRRYY
jgi:RNA recognition motif-containing protein